jgi:hypothetical protein
MHHRVQAHPFHDRAHRPGVLGRKAGDPGHQWLRSARGPDVPAGNLHGAVQRSNGTLLPGQKNLTTSGFGGAGGAISIFYQIILKEGNHFTTVWHNTGGPLIEGFGTDPGLTSPATGDANNTQFNAGVSPSGNRLVGEHLFALIDSLPPTDVEFGSVTTLGLATNAVRDPFLYTQHVRPQIYVPGHMTDVQLVSSSLQSRKAFILTEQAAAGSPEIPNGQVFEPELRWMVDPNDLGKPMVFNPDDERWANPAKEKIIKQFCHF